MSPQATPGSVPGGERDGAGLPLPMLVLFPLLAALLVLVAWGGSRLGPVLPAYFGPADLFIVLGLGAVFFVLFPAPALARRKERGGRLVPRALLNAALLAAIIFPMLAAASRVWPLPAGGLARVTALVLLLAASAQLLGARLGPWYAPLAAVVATLPLLIAYLALDFSELLLPRLVAWSPFGVVYLYGRGSEFFGGSAPGDPLALYGAVFAVLAVVFWRSERHPASAGA